jgi:dihydropteroate synthase
MVEEGASIIDVGGESTRPGAQPVPESEELARIIPVIERLRSAVEVPISVDTRKPSVAEEAVAAGASIVNDTLGEETDGRMAEVATRARAAVITMHSRGTPETMRSLTTYGDVVDDVKEWLNSQARTLMRAGIQSDGIVLDPGFGFAKTPKQNLELLHRLDEITDVSFPILVGTSRKSFIGAVLDLPENQRLEGTAATVALAVWKGARIVRVHDVLEMTRVVRMVEAIRAKEVDGN